MTKELKDFLRKYEPNTICSICQDSGFYLQIDEEVPKRLQCMRDDNKRKFDCSDHSGFIMKPKRQWFQFKVANMKTCFWEYYQTAEYKEGYFEDLEEVATIRSFI